MKRTTPFVVAVLLVFSSLQAAQNLVGDAGQGRKLFQEMKCIACHAVRGTGGKVGPELGVKAGVHDSPNAMAGAMWCHAIKMWGAMKKAGLEQPRISEQQAADLVAYIAGKVQTDKAGNIKRGEQVYAAKFCASCHDQYSGAPDFTKLAGRASPYWMVAGLWDHGSGMLSRMVARNTAWQTLSTQEVGDILAYLNNRK